MTPALVPPANLNEAWIKVLPYIRKLVDEAAGGRVTEMSLYRDVTSGHLQMWVVIDEEDDGKLVAFAMTRVPSYEKVKLVSIDFSGGEKMEQWVQPIYELIEKWSKEIVHADGIEICGRAGWERMLSRVGHDFKKKFTIIEKRFSDG